MALGLALVPRSSAGMEMSTGAAITAAAMTWGHVGRFAPASMISLLALAPVLDVALLGWPQGWQLYLRFILAGVAANTLAFLVKVATVFLGWEVAGGRHFTGLGSYALVSFVVCGALAGLMSAALWFRVGAADDIRRD